MGPRQREGRKATGQLTGALWRGAGCRRWACSWPTMLKLTVIDAPLLPVPEVKLHGVATKVWAPMEVGVQVKSNGAAESVFTTLPSLLNTTLLVLEFAWAVTV